MGALLRALAVAGIVVVSVNVLGGCTRANRADPSMTVSIPTGVWRGAISGLEMADAGGLASYSAELMLRPDGAFVLSDSSGARATGRVAMIGGTLVLDGAFVAPASRAEQAVVARLRPGRDDALYGTVNTLFRGLRLAGSAALSKAR